MNNSFILSTKIPLILFPSYRPIKIIPSKKEYPTLPFSRSPVKKSLPDPPVLPFSRRKITPDSPVLPSKKVSSPVGARDFFYGIYCFLQN